MRSNIEKVLRAFEAGDSAVGDSKRTCSTDGRTLFSYAMPIARRVGRTIYIVPYKMAPTATTRSQVRAAMVHFRGRYVESATLGEGEASRASSRMGSRSRASRYGNAKRAYWVWFSKQRIPVEVLAASPRSARIAAEIYERSGLYGKIQRVTLSGRYGNDGPIAAASAPAAAAPAPAAGNRYKKRGKGGTCLICGGGGHSWEKCPHGHGNRRAKVGRNSRGMFTRGR